MSAPEVKGWCPGAHRPMQSGDGLIMRVRPRLGQLNPAQALGLCQIAETFGNGIIDLTNRANLQLRGIAEGNNQSVLDALLALNLLDETPEIESRRNIICAPLRPSGGLTEALATELMERLSELPDLPAKFGFAIDADGPSQLRQAPADIRIETGSTGLMVRADGSRLGLSVTANTAVDSLISMAQWFVKTQSPEVRRMAKHLKTVPLPLHFTGETLGPAAIELEPTQYPQGRVMGAPFGSLAAEDLAGLLKANPTSTLTVTPFRMFMLSCQINANNSPFIHTANDPALSVDACPGAPHCMAAKQQTRAMAQSIISHLNGRSLHISGCTKGCAKPRAADVVLVGQTDGFDLVLNGCSWDEPVLRGIKPDSVADAVIKELGRH
jgi:precorrin-3B synthase